MPKSVSKDKHKSKKKPKIDPELDSLDLSDSEELNNEKGPPTDELDGMNDMEGLSDLESEMIDEPATFEDDIADLEELDQKNNHYTGSPRSQTPGVSFKSQMRDDPVGFIIREVDHLRYNDRKDILDIIIENVGTNVINESADGSRIDMNDIPDDTIRLIESLVEKRLHDVDITSKFKHLQDKPPEIEQDTTDTQDASEDQGDSDLDDLDDLDLDDLDLDDLDDLEDSEEIPPKKPPKKSKKGKPGKNQKKMNKKMSK